MSASGNEAPSRNEKAEEACSSMYATDHSHVTQWPLDSTDNTI